MLVVSTCQDDTSLQQPKKIPFCNEQEFLTVNHTALLIMFVSEINTDKMIETSMIQYKKIIFEE